MSARKKSIIIAAVLVPLVGVGGGAWWFADKQAKEEERQRIAAAQPAAERAAAGLAKASLEKSLLTNDSPDPKLNWVYGMAGNAKDHKVTANLGTVGDTQADVSFAHTWGTGIPDKKFTYATKGTLMWTGSAWKLQWKPEIALPSNDAKHRLKIYTAPPNTVKVINPNGQPYGRTAPGYLANLGKTGSGADGNGPTYIAELVSAENQVVRRIDENAPAATDADNGTIKATLDEGLQAKATDALKAAGKNGAIVAIRPSTGQIVAMTGSETGIVSYLHESMPGSTFKVVSSLALLRQGSSPTTNVQCTEKISAGGQNFKNYDAYPSSALGTITLTKALANSCNTAFIDATKSLPPDALAKAAGALGLTTMPQVGVKSSRGAVKSDLDRNGMAATAIGQGSAQSSPLGMATVAASVAAGHTVRPTLIASRTTTSDEPGGVTAAEAEALKTMMRACVTEGTCSDLAGIPGGPAYGKTGTAQTGDGSTTDAWMIAIHKDLAVAVYVQGGASGGHVAGPIMKTFLTAAAR